jgi:uncharacterized membrane protein
LVIIGLFSDDFGFLLYIVLFLLGLSVFFAMLVMSWVVLAMRTDKPVSRPSMWLIVAKVMMVGPVIIALALFGIYVFR